MNIHEKLKRFMTLSGRFYNNIFLSLANRKNKKNAVKFTSTISSLVAELLSSLGAAGSCIVRITPQNDCPLGQDTMSPSP